MNAKTSIKMIAVTFALIAGGAGAAEWQAAGVAGQRLAVYVNGAAVRSGGDAVARLEVLEDFGQVQYLSGQSQAHRSRASTLLVDCGTRQVGFEAWRLHEGAQGQGQVVWRWESEGRVAMFQPIAGSSHERVLERACGGPVVATAQ
jgi:hypothetical protein